VFVCAPSDGGVGANSQITSTDRVGIVGRNTDPVTGDYLFNFGGTSAAAPQIAGVAALLLEANPALGWRDVKHILAHTSRRLQPSDPGWSLNAAGLAHHDRLGFGLADAHAAVSLARVWTPVPAEESVPARSVVVNQPIQDGSGTALATPVYGATVETSTVVTASLRLETIELTLNATHPYRGDLEVVLRSPSGVESVLAAVRNDSGDHYANWTFTSVKHWDEFAAGRWTLRVRDGIINDAGTLNSWTLTLHGTPAAVLPRIRSIRSDGLGGLLLDFPTEAGVTYEAFSCQDLASGEWTPTGVRLTGAGAPATLAVTPPENFSATFYVVAPVSY
jgi:subtilisin-like proprotein convertase family protein